MASRQNDLRAARLLQNIQNVRANPVSATVVLLWNLFTYRQYRFSPAQVDDDVSSVYPLNDSVNDLSLSANKAFIDDTPFRIFHLLDNDLFRRLGRDSPKGCGIHFRPNAVSHFTSGIELTCFLKIDFQVGFGHFFHHVFELEDLDFTALFIIADLDVYTSSKFLPGSGPKGLFKGPDEDLLVNPPVTTDLFNDFPYVRH